MGGQGQFDFFVMGGGVLLGVQSKLEQKSRGGQGNFFFYNLHRDYFFFKWEGKARRGMIQSNKKIQAGWAHGGFYQIFIFRVFFSFNAAASVDYIYLQAGRVRPGGEGSGGSRPNFFFYNFHRDYFFFKWEGKAKRGMIQSDKKFHAGWAHGGF